MEQNTNEANSADCVARGQQEGGLQRRERVIGRRSEEALSEETDGPTDRETEG